MIEQINFLAGSDDSYHYGKNNYYDFIKNFNDYFYNQVAIVSWKFNEKTVQFSDENVKHIPLKNWDGIAFITNSGKSVTICNPDGSVRFTIPVPTELIQWEDYVTHFRAGTHPNNRYQSFYDRFDDYFEFQGSFYIQIRISMRHPDDPFDAWTQMRYINAETGEFLPFTKLISRMEPNQYAYNEEHVKL